MTRHPNNIQPHTIDFRLRTGKHSNLLPLQVEHQSKGTVQEKHDDHDGPNEIGLRALAHPDGKKVENDGPADALRDPRQIVTDPILGPVFGPGLGIENLVRRPQLHRQRSQTERQEQ